jgi:hypothetical protein
MGFRGRKYLLFPVDRTTGRRENDFPYSVLYRLLQNIESPEYVHLRIENRILNRFSDIHLGCKMHHDARPFIAKDSIKPPTLDIGLIETACPIEIAPPPCGQVINHDDFVTLQHQSIY